MCSVCDVHLYANSLCLSLTSESSPLVFVSPVLVNITDSLSYFYYYNHRRRHHNYHVIVYNCQFSLICFFLIRVVNKKVDTLFAGQRCHIIFHTVTP